MPMYSHIRINIVNNIPNIFLIIFSPINNIKIIPINKCFIQTELSQKIAKYIIDNWNESIYNEETQKGLLRNIMIREGFGTHEVMVVLVQTKEKNVFEKENSNLSIEILTYSMNFLFISNYKKYVTIKKLYDII